MIKRDKEKSELFCLLRRLLPRRIYDKYLASGKTRLHLLLIKSLTAGGIYAAANLVSAIRYRSVWFLSVAVYYLLLLLTRYLLFRQNKRADSVEDVSDFVGYRRASLIMLAVNAAMAVMIVYTVGGRRNEAHSRIILAWLAVYSLTVFLYNLFCLLQHRDGKSTLRHVYRIISLSASLMSIFNFQCSLLSSVSLESELEFALNSLL